MERGVESIGKTKGILRLRRGSFGGGRVGQMTLKEQPEDEALLLTVSPEQARQVALAAFEEKHFGPDQKNFKAKIREKWKYYRTPAEALAWAIQITYLRDEEKLPKEDILTRLRTLSGGHSKGEVSQFEQDEISHFYEIRDLRAFAELQRQRAAKLAK